MRIMELDDSRVMRTIRHAGGYTRTYESYGHGDPGWYAQVGRDADCEVMWSGPYSGTTGPYRHGDWTALADRAHITAALQQAPACSGCGVCDHYRATAAAARAAGQAQTLRGALACVARLDDVLEHRPDAGTSDEWDDRNQAVWRAHRAAKALGMPTGIQFDPSAHPYSIVVLIELPTGQVSGHVPPSRHSHGVHTGGIVWDGHTRDEKAERIAAYLARPEVPA